MEPKAPVRRYDVFAAYSYLDALEDGMPAAEAKRYGIWLATVVAARKFNRRAGMRPSSVAGEHAARSDFLGLTAKDYGTRVRARMGAAFHDRVFLPALKRLREAGRSYMDVRDSARAEWVPAAKARAWRGARLGKCPAKGVVTRPLRAGTRRWRPRCSRQPARTRRCAPR